MGKIDEGREEQKAKENKVRGRRRTGIGSRWKKTSWIIN